MYIGGGVRVFGYVRVLCARRHNIRLNIVIACATSVTIVFSVQQFSFWMLILCKGLMLVMRLRLWSIFPFLVCFNFSFSPPLIFSLHVLSAFFVSLNNYLYFFLSRHFHLFSFSVSMERFLGNERNFASWKTGAKF